MPRLTGINPILSVRDVAASVRHYQGVLGFRCDFTWGDPATFAGISRDGVEIMFCKDGQGNPGTWVTVWVDDVDALFDEFTSSGADIRKPPIDLPWGVREMNVADPDGHRLRFSTPTDRRAGEVDSPFGE
jgi:uncharacterized glyoxalase superfamily protein PhnB